MKTRNYNQKDEDAVKKVFAQYWTDTKFLDELAQELRAEACQFYVTLSNEGIVGIAGLRKPATHLNGHADTKNPTELYIIASKYKNQGIGNLLGLKVIEEAKKLKFTEILCYSPETHSSSWPFYEKLGFTKHGTIKDPDDGYPGILWQKII